ncbi:RDD family protein [Streptomonospora salina]|uniref:Putative RDD family membrane protein YckC n=1 Tax=Streptomonospora salina TaxID=104205 RepID=A0A841EII8_9ACTN|nr:RDD family protein [Streptomonospora salina]MBB6000628.1 putative RDD family membrane protein YckC [Streptomonospora salina]
MSADTPVERPAGFGRRVAARLIDLVVLGGIAMLFSALVFNALPGTEDPLRLATLPALVLSVGLFAIYLAYETVFTALYGATPGKLYLGLRVVPADPPAGAARAGAAAVLKRSVVLYVSVLLNFVPIASFLALMVSVYAVISAFFDRPRRRGLHDKAGGTAVVSGTGPDRGGASGR